MRAQIPPGESFPSADGDTGKYGVARYTPPTEPEVREFGPADYWMSSPREANRLGVRSVWRKSGGYELPDPDDL